MHSDHDLLESHPGKSDRNGLRDDPSEKESNVDGTTVMKRVDLLLFSYTVTSEDMQKTA